MKINIKHNSFIYKTISFSGQLLIRMTEAVLAFFAKEKEAVINTKKFSWTANVEQDTSLILSELRSIMTDYESIPGIGDISAEQKRIIAGERSWKTFMLYAYGARVDRNASLCPETERSIRAIPGMTTAFFSILEPHTSLIPHRGPYKGILRYHLGLMVPEPSDLCGIKVDGATYHWQVGRSLIFDDTYIHEAWNNSDEKRVVLFVDFKRDYAFPINLMNDAMIALIRVSPFVSNVLKKLEDRNVIK